MSWTKQAIETVKEMWTKGASAAEISRALGGEFTRSSVLGKVHRLKLPGHSANPVKVLRPKKQKALNPNDDRRISAKLAHGRKRGNTNGGLGFKIARARKDGLSTADAMEAVLGRHAEPFLDPDDGVDVTGLIGILQLNEHTCKWPKGDPLKAGFGFCGATPVEGKPYCPKHMARAYTKPDRHLEAQKRLGVGT